jgi:hypothetical protein
MQFTTSIRSALPFLLVALAPSVKAACNSNEIGVGYVVTCFLGSPEGGNTCNYEPTLFDSSCNGLDESVPQVGPLGDYCKGGWKSSTVKCNVSPALTFRIRCRESVSS